MILLETLLNDASSFIRYLIKINSFVLSDILAETITALYR